MSLVEGARNWFREKVQEYRERQQWYDERFRRYDQARKSGNHKEANQALTEILERQAEENRSQLETRVSVILPFLRGKKLIQLAKTSLATGTASNVISTLRKLASEQECPESEGRNGRDTVKNNWDRKEPPLPPPEPETESRVRPAPQRATVVKVLPPISIPRRRLFSEGELPARRIAKPNWGQTETQTVMKPIMTVQQSLERREFGQILHEPLAQRETLFRRRIPQQSLEGFKGRQAANWGRLLYSVANGSAELAALAGEESLQAPEFDSQIGVAFIPLPDSLRESENPGEVFQILVGIDEIQEYFNEMNRRTIAANQAVTGVIPLEIQYRDNMTTLPVKPTKLPFKISRLGKIQDTLGIDEFPVTLPRSLLNRFPNENGEVPDPTENAVTVRNYWELIDWLITALDEVFGVWPQEIQIEDTDPLTTGNQTVKIPLFNIAETLSGIAAAAIHNQSQVETLKNITVRTLIEAGLARKEAIEGKAFAEANATYLNYKGKETSIKVPYTFKIPDPDDTEEMTERLDRLLQESEQQIKIFEYSDESDLQGQLVDLKQAAAIIRARYYYRLNGEGTTKEQVMGLMRRLASLVDAEPNQQPSEDTGDSFDRFLNRVEQGFAGEAGNSEPDQAYGRDFNRRPKIRRFNRLQDD